MLFRRLRNSEQNELKEFCRKSTRWSRYYDRHDLWVDKALKDVSSLDRVVFGAFELDNTEGYEHNHKLVACLFLKLSQFEHSIEFKSLILPTDDIILNKDSIDIAKKLIEKAIRFCEIRNIRKIEIELPQEEHSIISIFLEYNFKIVALRDRYNPLNTVCILERSIGDKYYGDPFDAIKFAYWLLGQYLPCEIMKEAIETPNGIVKMPFVANSNSKIFSKENPTGNKKRLRGILWIIESSESPDDDIGYVIKESRKNEGISLLLIDFLTEDQKKELANNKIIFFDKVEAKEIAGGDISSMNIPINNNEIGGVITVLEYEQIIKYSRRETLTYYLFSGLHEGLNLPDNESTILAIYCPNWENNAAGIVGFSEIERINRLKFRDLLNEPIPHDSALSKEDLYFYGTYSFDERVAKLDCNQLHIFSKPLPIRNGEWINSQNVRDYLYNEIICNGINSTYLDNASCYNIKQIKEKTTLLENSQKHEIMIESIITAISVLADLTDIGSFTQDQVVRFKNNLNRESKKTESKISNSPRVAILIDTHIQELDSAITSYKNIRNANDYNNPEKDNYSKIIASRALKVLETIKPFKDNLSDYDDLVVFFQNITKV
ncbi:MAG: hypothetical protein JST82_01325 [Bacteroidetes bacterium]|nr:hypothetical protein [Bacteroidota bacterium]